jgi:polysaccharide export outer membrane protein
MRRLLLLIAGVICCLPISTTSAAAQTPMAAAAPPGTFHPLPPSGAQTTTAGEYRIRPLDKLDVIVFQVRELTLQNLQVDSTGQIGLPLVGAVQVSGRTANEVSNDIAGRLRGTYLRSPQVTVIVSERAPEKVTVQGAVTLAGVFEMHGRTSLAEAVAMAHGTTRTADPHHVAIVRNIDGQPRAAVFDMQAINNGQAPNPEVLADDVIVVNDSRSRTLWRNVIEALPALAVLSYLGL